MSTTFSNYYILTSKSESLGKSRIGYNETMKKSTQILVFKGTNSLRSHDAAHNTTHNVCTAGIVSQCYRKEIYCRIYIGQTVYPTT